MGKFKSAQMKALRDRLADLVEDQAITLWVAGQDRFLEAGIRDVTADGLVSVYEIDADDSDYGLVIIPVSSILALKLKQTSTGDFLICDWDGKEEGFPLLRTRAEIEERQKGE